MTGKKTSTHTLGSTRNHDAKTNAAKKKMAATFLECCRKEPTKPTALLGGPAVVRSFSSALADARGQERPFY